MCTDKTPNHHDTMWFHRITKKKTDTLSNVTFNYDCNGNNHWKSQCKTEEFIVHSCRNKRVICLNLFNSWVIVIPAVWVERERKKNVRAKKKERNRNVINARLLWWYRLWYYWEMCSEWPVFWSLFLSTHFNRSFVLCPCF